LGAAGEIASSDAQEAGAVHDAGDESDHAENDGEGCETFSTLVNGNGEKQQRGNDSDKNHVNRPSAVGDDALGELRAHHKARIVPPYRPGPLQALAK
jgi:hypothetical protein